MLSLPRPASPLHAPPAPIRSELRPSASRHVALALVQLPGPLHAIAPSPHLRISCNVGPPFAFEVMGAGPRSTFLCERHALLVVPPDLALVCEARSPRPAGRAHKPARLATFQISRELLADSAISLGLSRQQAQLRHEVLPTDEVLRLTAQTLIADLRDGHCDGVEATERLAKALLARLLLRLQQRAGDPARHSLDRVREHIDRHLHDTLALDGLAALAGLSRFHFCRVFRERQGMTPHQYIVQRRIEQAQRLLWANRDGAGPARTMLEIALACGFGSPSHFAAQFKRHTGRTPLQWQSAQDGPRSGFS